MVSAAGAGTMSVHLGEVGQAASTRAPRARNTRGVLRPPRRTSSSTGIRPSRSGVQATRQPLIEGCLHRAGEAGRVDVVGQRRAVVGAGHGREHERDVGRPCAPSARSRRASPSPASRDVTG